MPGDRQLIARAAPSLERALASEVGDDIPAAISSAEMTSQLVAHCDTVENLPRHATVASTTASEVGWPSRGIQRRRRERL